MKTYDEHVADVLQAPDYFVACDFQGRGVYLRVQRKTLPAIRKAAQELIDKRSTSTKRPIIIYAAQGIHQIVVENVIPA